MSSPISGFTAVPNPQMLAFMAAQSFVMMYQAGEGWQYGKRKQSAMSNEEFNKQTPISIMENQAATLRQALPTIQKSMDDMTPMIRTIIAQYGDFIREIIATIPEFLGNITGSSTKQQTTTIAGKPGVASFITGFAADVSRLQNLERSGVGTSLPSTDSFFQAALKDRQENDRVDQLKLSIKNMSKSVASATAAQLPFMGFDAKNFSILSKLLLAKINQTGGFVGKTLPSSTNILKQTKVSKQTLRRQRTLLISNVRSAKSELSRNTNRLSTVRTNIVKRNAQMIKVNRSRASLKKSQQALANFLDRWKGVKY